MRRKRNKPAKIQPGQPITRADYPAVFGDIDRDKLPDVDDPRPTKPGDTESIEEVQLSDEIGALIDTREDYVEVMEDLKKELRTIGRKGSYALGRVKTPYSILNKLRRKKLDELTDLAGTMLVVKDQKNLERVKKAIQDRYEILDFDDYYKDPLGGYRAYHFIVEKDGVPVEIQLKTKRMKTLADAAHTAYKRGELNSETLDKLSRLALKADKGDRAAQKKFQGLTPGRLRKMLNGDSFEELVLNPSQPTVRESDLVKALKF